MDGMNFSILEDFGTANPSLPTQPSTAKPRRRSKVTHAPDVIPLMQAWRDVRKELTSQRKAARAGQALNFDDLQRLTGTFRVLANILADETLSNEHPEITAKAKRYLSNRIKELLRSNNPAIDTQEHQRLTSLRENQLAAILNSNETLFDENLILYGQMARFVVRNTYSDDIKHIAAKDQANSFKQRITERQDADRKTAIEFMQSAFVNGMNKSHPPTVPLTSGSMPMRSLFQLMPI